ncbi:MAG: hypothetical protein ACFFEE_04270, partial [Candidatus Thorarchaeota archaeon]
IHYQTATGTQSNLELLVDNKWKLPNFLGKGKIDILSNSYFASPPIIKCGGVRPEFTQADLAIATQIQSDSRAGPSRVSTSLLMRDIDVDARRVATVDKKLRENKLFLPYVLFSGLGLSSNFCFEIICNEQWKERTLALVSQFPWVMYYLSSRGVIIWTMSPGPHQVEYYQMFRTLEQNSGVDKVHPIMTITQGGSRSMMDLTKNLTYESGVWSVRPEDVDLTDYISDLE